MKKLVHILVIILSISVSSFGQLQKKHSAKEIKADLEYLKDAMEASNHNFYALTPIKIMDSLYADIMHSIEDSLSGLQAFRLFQPPMWL